MFTGSGATVCDIYDSFCDQNETSKSEKADYPESTVNPRRGQEERGEKSSSSTVGTGNNTWENIDSVNVQFFVRENSWDWRELIIVSVLKPFIVLYPISIMSELTIFAVYLGWFCYTVHVSFSRILFPQAVP